MDPGGFWIGLIIIALFFRTNYSSKKDRERAGSLLTNGIRWIYYRTNPGGFQAKAKSFAIGKDSAIGTFRG
jgi:hypothetical protein